MFWDWRLRLWNLRLFICPRGTSLLYHMCMCPEPPQAQSNWTKNSGNGPISLSLFILSPRYKASQHNLWVFRGSMVIWHGTTLTTWSLVIFLSLPIYYFNVGIIPIPLLCREHERKLVLIYCGPLSLWVGTAGSEPASITSYEGFCSEGLAHSLSKVGVLWFVCIDLLLLIILTCVVSLRIVSTSLLLSSPSSTLVFHLHFYHCLIFFYHP